MPSINTHAAMKSIKAIGICLFLSVWFAFGALFVMRGRIDCTTTDVIYLDEPCASYGIAILSEVLMILSFVCILFALIFPFVLRRKKEDLPHITDRDQ